MRFLKKKLLYQNCCTLPISTKVTVVLILKLDTARIMQSKE